MLRTLYEHGRGTIGLIGDAQLRTTLETILPATLREASGTDQLAHVLDRAEAVAIAGACVRSFLSTKSRRSERGLTAPGPPVPAARTPATLRRPRRVPVRRKRTDRGPDPVPPRRRTRLPRHRASPRPNHHPGVVRRANARVQATRRDNRAVGDRDDPRGQREPPRAHMLAARETHARAEMVTPPGHATRGIAILAVEAVKHQRLWAIDETE